MDWKIFQEDVDDGNIPAVVPEDFDDQPLSVLPENMTILISLASHWLYWIRREGQEVELWPVAKKDPPELAEQFSSSAISDAILRAVQRLIAEGRPYSDFCLTKSEPVLPWLDPERGKPTFKITYSACQAGREVLKSTNEACDEVCGRALKILQGGDSVLLLGKDSGPELAILLRIKTELTQKGLQATIIKQESDRPGESVIQKVLRYALVADFVIVENSVPSGHLYELPHIAKMAESIVAVFQREGTGATWMFEDAYFRHSHWKKFNYDDDTLASVVDASVAWARDFRRSFQSAQKVALPWIK